jgi:hypothetical protein
MAVTIESQANGTTTNPTKPTALSVGDLMVVLYHARKFSATTTITPPAGWTTIEYLTGTTIAGGAYYKIADASDVLASDYAFTGTNDQHSWFIYRISGFDAGDVLDGSASASDDATASSMSMAGYTPVNNNTFNFISFCSNGNSKTTSGYAHATNDPTWTEEYDVQQIAVQSSIAVATRPSSGATGNISLNFSGVLANRRLIGFAINEATNIDYPVTAVVGAFTLTGITTIINSARTLLANTVSFTLTGINTILRLGIIMLADTSTFILTGYDAILSKLKILITETGSFTLTGNTTILRTTRKILASVGTFILTGINAIINFDGWINIAKENSTWSNNSKSTSTWVNKDK